MEGGGRCNLLSRLHLVEVEVLFVSADKHLSTAEKRRRVDLLRHLEGNKICFRYHIVHIDTTISSVQNKNNAYW